MKAVIEFRHVWKQYSMSGLVGRALHAIRGPVRELSRLGKGKGWAVRDVDFQLRSGQTLGIIGRNGSGKTTILRLLSGITRPTAGTVRTRGRVASLIALGAGFHKELTGRENIFLNGTILGLRRQEIARKLKDIVDFAELGGYIDMPVKFYSSGMYARLGFSVAVHVDPDVLLVDEVLSVGDQGFQSKSLRRMTEFARQGCTVIFVSHRLPAVSTMCSDTIWLDGGVVRAFGPTDQVVKEYLDDFDQQLIRMDPEAVENAGSGEVMVERVVLTDLEGNPQDEFVKDEPMVVEVHYRARVPVRNPVFILIVSRMGGSSLFAANMLLDGYEMGELSPGPGVIRCSFERLPLLPGRYTISPQVKRDISGNAFEPRPMATFQVSGHLADYGLSGPLAQTYAPGSLPIHVPYSWSSKRERTGVPSASATAEPAKQV